jgi:hypothetical protein
MIITGTVHSAIDASQSGFKRINDGTAFAAWATVTATIMLAIKQHA